MNNRIDGLDQLSANELRETTGGWVWLAFGIGVLYGILSESW
jgi:hypothetical protein